MPRDYSHYVTGRGRIEFYVHSNGYLRPKTNALRLARKVRDKTTLVEEIATSLKLLDYDDIMMGQPRVARVEAGEHVIGKYDWHSGEITKPPEDIRDRLIMQPQTGAGTIHLCNRAADKCKYSDLFGETAKEDGDEESDKGEKLLIVGGEDCYDLFRKCIFAGMYVALGELQEEAAGNLESEVIIIQNAQVSGSTTDGDSPTDDSKWYRHTDPNLQRSVALLPRECKTSGKKTAQHLNKILYFAALHGYTNVIVIGTSVEEHAEEFDAFFDRFPILEHSIRLMILGTNMNEYLQHVAFTVNSSTLDNKEITENPLSDIKLEDYLDINAYMFGATLDTADPIYMKNMFRTHTGGRGDWSLGSINDIQPRSKQDRNEDYKSRKQKRIDKLEEYEEDRAGVLFSQDKANKKEKEAKHPNATEEMKKEFQSAAEDAQDVKLRYHHMLTQRASFAQVSFVENGKLPPIEQNESAYMFPCFNGSIRKSNSKVIDNLISKDLALLRAHYGLHKTQYIASDISIDSKFDELQKRHARLQQEFESKKIRSAELNQTIYATMKDVGYKMAKNVEEKRIFRTIDALKATNDFTTPEARILLARYAINSMPASFLPHISSFEKLFDQIFESYGPRIGALEWRFTRAVPSAPPLVPNQRAWTKAETIGFKVHSLISKEREHYNAQIERIVAAYAEKIAYPGMPANIDTYEKVDDKVQTMFGEFDKNKQNSYGTTAVEAENQMQRIEEYSIELQEVDSSIQALVGAISDLEEEIRKSEITDMKAVKIIKGVQGIVKSDQYNIVVVPVFKDVDQKTESILDVLEKVMDVVSHLGFRNLVIPTSWVSDDLAITVIANLIEDLEGSIPDNLRLVITSDTTLDDETKERIKDASEIITMTFI